MKLKKNKGELPLSPHSTPHPCQKETLKVDKPSPGVKGKQKYVISQYLGRSSCLMVFRCKSDFSSSWNLNNSTVDLKSGWLTTSRYTVLSEKRLKTKIKALTELSAVSSFSKKQFLLTSNQHLGCQADGIFSSLCREKHLWLLQRKMAKGRPSDSLKTARLHRGKKSST